MCRFLVWTAAPITALALAAMPALAAAVGPGVPAVKFAPEELFKPLARIEKSVVPGFHGTAAMVRGYFVIPYSAGINDGGYAFFDISNPRAPTLVHREPHPDAREGHSIGFRWHEGRLHAVTQASRGLLFWDWTDVRAPKLVAAMQLPDVEPSDYDNGLWWLCWQAPFVYAGGSSRGLYIVDARDPATPTLLTHVPISATGGFRIGTTLAVGNLLVIAANDQPGIATLDISDPARPALVASTRDVTPYSAMVNGDKLFIAGSGTTKPLAIYDLRDGRNLELLASTRLTDKGGYLTIQDEWAHIGVSSDGYHKIRWAEPSPFQVVGRADLPEQLADVDFVSVLGNLVVAGDDDGFGSMIVAHATEPDTTAPAVTMIVPRPDAVGMALTSRIGLTFSDQIDITSVDSTTVIVRPLGGTALSGTYSGQTGIVNFAPGARLAPDTTYEVVVVAGGVRDVAGNPLTTTYTSRFSTGGSLSTLGCTLKSTQASRVGQTVAFSATACSEPGLSYSWEFGDGTVVTAPSSSTNASHRFTTAGRFTVMLRVAKDTRAGTASQVHTVTWPVTPTRPSRSSSMALDPARATLYVANADNDSVSLISTATNSLTLERPVCRNPSTLALALPDELWVVCRDDATIVVLRRDDLTSLATVKLPYASSPYGIVVGQQAGRVWVTLVGVGAIVEVDVATRTLLRSVATGPKPRALAVSHDGSRILVTRLVSPPDHGEVVEIDPVQFKVVNTIQLAVDPGPDTDSTGVGVPNYLLAVSLTPDGREAWVAAKKDNTGRGSFRNGQRLTFENTVRAMVGRIELGSGARSSSERLAARLDLNNRALPADIAFSPGGDLAFVVTLASGTVDIIDALSGTALTSIEFVGIAPRAALVSDDGSRLYVDCFLSRRIVVHDLTSLTTVNLAPRVASIPTVQTEQLAADVLLGKRVFHDSSDRRMSRDRYLSCVVCHLDGGSDARVWDFTDRGEGLRNTISLKGRGGFADGPLHWSGNFDETQDFEGDIRNAFEGQGFLSDADWSAGSRSQPLGDPKAGLSVELDALARYVLTLDHSEPSPYRGADGTMTSAALAGAALFSSPTVGCIDCHYGRGLTDSGRGPLPYTRHDVGTFGRGSGGRLSQTLSGLDTPALNGVWSTAPYLHDGSALTLRDVLSTNNQHELHGKTLALSSNQLDALVSYLQQLDDGQSNCAEARVVAIQPDQATVGSQYHCLFEPLTWQPVVDATGYDVYLGVSEPLAFAGSVTAASFSPIGLELGATYLWRVDAVHGVCITRGPVWSFTTANGVGARIDKLNRYQARLVRAGGNYFEDRPFTITNLPPELDESLMISTNNDDKNATAADWLTFELDVEAEVWVAYDARATSRPNWLSTFAPTGVVVGVSDPSQATATLWSRTYSRGRVTLGGNAAAGAAGFGSNYFVLVRAKNWRSCAVTAKTVVVRVAKSGDNIRLVWTGGTPPFAVFGGTSHDLADLTTVRSVAKSRSVVETIVTGERFYQIR